MTLRDSLKINGRNDDKAELVKNWVIYIEIVHLKFCR